MWKYRFRCSAFCSIDCYKILRTIQSMFLDAARLQVYFCLIWAHQHRNQCCLDKDNYFVLRILKITLFP